MRSTIRIDLNEENEPIIVIEAVSTSDLRDKVLKKFFENLSGGCMLSVRCVHTENGMDKWEVSVPEQEMITVKQQCLSGQVILNQVTPVTNHYFRDISHTGLQMTEGK